MFKSFLIVSLCLLAAVVLADDLRDLSATDEPVSLDAASLTAKQPNLGEEEKFGFGGLMTSGSFVMASTGFEEEEELGEGEGVKFGFGGLMTSGSFVMASTGFEEEEELGEGEGEKFGFGGLMTSGS